jgi:hypothetical protein
VTVIFMLDITIVVVRLEVFMVMKIQVMIFQVLTPCSNVVGYQRFGGPFFWVLTLCSGVVGY